MVGFKNSRNARSHWRPPLTPLTPVARLSTEIQPESISRYPIIRELGPDGFGLVYLTFDGKLARQIAIKVPHLRFLVSQNSD